MDYKQEITELKTELKGFDLGRLGQTSDDLKNKSDVA